VDDEVLMAKFEELAGLVIGESERAELRAALVALDRMDDVRALLPLLQLSRSDAHLGQRV
jgi:hypothetical protein